MTAQPPEDTTLVRSISFVVSATWDSPFSTKSNYAREHASEIAAACSLGFISTSVEFSVGTKAPVEDAYEFGHVWRLTLKGAELLSRKTTTP